MYAFLKLISKYFTFITALFVTLLSTRVKGLNPHNSLHHCSQQQLVECARPLAILSESHLSFIANKTDLLNVCPDLKKSIKCINSYTRMCMNLRQRKHFKRLFEGTSETINDLCDNTTYQQEYLKYAPCMQQIADENADCFAQYERAMVNVDTRREEDKLQVDDVLINRFDASGERKEEEDLIEYQRKRKRQLEDQSIRNVCCTFQEYVYCSTSVTERTCGWEAADFSQKFLHRMSSAMIQMHCSDYGARQCGLLLSTSSALSVKSDFYAAISLLSTITLFGLFKIFI